MRVEARSIGGNSTLLRRVEVAVDQQVVEVLTPQQALQLAFELIYAATGDKEATENVIQ